MKIFKRFLCLAGVLTLWLAAAPAQGAMTFTTLASFDDTNSGANPYSPPVLFTDGNLYGVNPYGGTNSAGVIYKVTTNAVLTTLHTFNTADGSYPVGQLTAGSDGNLYGVASSGGTNGAGTIFSLTTNGILTTLYSFGSVTNDPGTNGLSYDLDGTDPYGGMIQGKDGNFYGVTYDGGVSNLGTVFQFSTNGTLTTLYSFTGNGSNDDGAYPYTAPLVEGSPGVFYGTTSSGGTNNDGTVFQITAGGMLTILFEFNQTNGLYPYAGLSFGSDGNLYGTTIEGGSNNCGTVFQITTNGNLTTLFQFNGTNGVYPEGGVVPGLNNNLYGTTYQGGAKGFGTVFKLTTNGVLTTLYSFTNKTDGANPYAGVIRDAKGNLYGAALYGGKIGYGTVFRLSDTNPPTLTFVSPTSNQRWSNSVFTVTGTAKDNVAVANVYYSPDAVNWTAATTTNGYTNWTGQVTLTTPGTNTLYAYAMDDSGNLSTTNTVKLIYVAYAPLTVITNGFGTLNQNYNGASLQIGNNYSIKATPKTGIAFTSWTGGTSLPLNLLTNGATLQFMMQSNLILQANFTDTNKPTLKITAPTAGQRMTNALAIVKGTAADNWQLGGVWYQLNGGSWNQPSTTNGWTNWTTTVELQNSTNILNAYAVDTSGNFSTTGSVSFISSNAFQLQLTFPSGAALTPDGLNVTLQLSPKLSGHIQVSTNLVNWTTLTNFSGTNTTFNFLDKTATNRNAGFYRAVIP